MLWTAGALAAALVADLDGDVRVTTSSGKSRAVVPGQRLGAGSLITTAGGSRITLRFDDGQWAALHEDTALRIQEFRFQAAEPASDRAVFVLLRGVLRMITGALGHRNPEAFELQAPKIIIGVRGTDFMVAVADSTYLTVLEGTVVATNAGGSATFTAGDFGAALEDAAAPAAVSGGALPAAVASAFGSLGARRIAPPAESAAPRGSEHLKGERDRDRGSATAAEARERARGAGAKGRVK